MNKESKIKVLAELDGFTTPSEKIPLWSHPNFTFDFLENRLPKYLTSYDAIIPLVVKWCKSQKGVNGWQAFSSQALKYNCAEVSAVVDDLFTLTPSQLCDALIHATGKWQEE